MKRQLFEAKVGDRIHDTKKNEIGIVVRTGASGNYNVIYVSFHGKTRRIIPMDDMQRFGRYELAD